MHVGLVATFRAEAADRVPSFERIRSAIEAAVRTEPRLLARLAPWRLGVPPRLEASAAFRIDQHVRIHPPASGIDLAVRIDALLSRPLDRRIPLWEIWVLSAQPTADCFTLVCKFHHALLDGSSGVALIERVFGGVTRRPELAALPRARRTRRSRAGLLGTLRASARFFRTALQRGPATELNGEVRLTRQHRSIQSELETLDAGAAKLGGTRNDALLAAVAGALRTSLDGEPPALRAFCPVNMRARGDRSLGNRISMWILALPVQQRDLETRMRLVRETTQRLKRGGDAAGGMLLDRLVAGLGAWAARFSMNFAAWRRSYQIVITNVSGPASELSMLGARLTSLVPFAPLFPGQRVAVAAMTYAGRLHVGVSDGFPSPAFGDRFANSIGRELADVECHSDAVPPALQRTA